jgi:hypothetical protein
MMAGQSLKLNSLPQPELDPEYDIVVTKGLIKSKKLIYFVRNFDAF